MDTKRVARRKAGALLQRFFAHLTNSLASGTEELWHKAERRLAQPPAEPPSKPAVLPGVLRTPVQQQPMQQAQAKTKGDKK